MSDTTNDASFVRITNREIYDSLNELRSSVVTMDNRMNNILGENVELRVRVRSLELKVYTMLAGFTTAIIAGGLALAKGVLG